MLKTQNYSNSYLNSSQASTYSINKPIETYNVTNNNNIKDNSIDVSAFSPKKDKTQKSFTTPHISYFGYLKKNGYSFPNEKRFKWQDLDHRCYPTGINTFGKQKRTVKCKSKEEYETKKRKKKCESNASKNNLYERTKRVILSEVNEKDEDYINKRHKKYHNLNQFINVGKGGMKSLIEKTPLKFNYRGKKIIKKSHSFDLNLFMNNYALIHLPKNRKHYVGKDNVKELFSRNRNNSLDSYKEDKSYRKFQNNSYINPKNLHVNIYKNF
jgi:hypothetical protein